MVSKKVTLNAAGDAATVADAEMADIFTTYLSTTEAVTGVYGILQKVGGVVLGMVIQSKRMGGGFNPFSI